MIRVTRKVLRILNSSQKKLLIIIVIMMLIGALLESLGVSLILPLVNSVINETGWNTAWYSRIICFMFGIENRDQYVKVLLVLLIAIFILKDAYLLFEYYVQYGYTARNRYRMQNQLMQKYMHKPYAFFLNLSSGEVLRIITEDTNMTTILLMCLLQVYTELIVGMVLAVTIVLISPLIASILAGALIVEMLLMIRVMKPAMRRMGDRFLKERAAVNKWIMQALQGIKSVKVSNTEKYFEDKHNAHAKGVVEAERKNQTYNKIPQLFIEASTVSVVLGVVLILLMNGLEIASIVPALSVFVFAAIRLLPSVNKISTGMNGVIYNEKALDNVIKNLKEEQDESDYMSENCEAEENGNTLSFDTNLCLKNVTFSYPGSEVKILENANMEISAGQSVGIIGTSGAGKTTAVDIMLGLLTPQSGRVLADGVDIEENKKDWLAHLAYIPQQIFLIDDTIKANVAFGRHKAEIDETRVWTALQEAQLEKFVRSLPDGIETSIGEAGMRLSGGQRQRIGIARALYNDPDILFFDEATSALDSETEAAVMEAINHLKGSRTLIIIAHRLSTIEKCDEVYRVENGKIEKV